MSNGINIPYSIDQTCYYDLPEDTKETTQLTALGFNPLEIAEILNISRKTVTRKLTKIKKPRIKKPFLSIPYSRGVKNETPIPHRLI